MDQNVGESTELRKEDGLEFSQWNRLATVDHVGNRHVGNAAPVNIASSYDGGWGWPVIAAVSGKSTAMQ